MASCGFLAVRGQSLFDRRKAAFEFEVGRTQDAFRVGLEMPGKIDHGEQQIADLAGDFVLIVAVERGFDLVSFLADLGEHGARIVPVEADTAGFVLQLQGAG